MIVADRSRPAAARAQRILRAIASNGSKTLKIVPKAPALIPTGVYVRLFLVRSVTSITNEKYEAKTLVTSHGRRRTHELETKNLSR